MDAGVRTKKE